MAALKPRYGRPGRLKHQFSAPALPALWIEIGNEVVPDPTDEIWSLPNTYPFLSFDIRFGRKPNGLPETFFDTDITPQSLANLVQQVTEAYVDAFGPLFSRLGKPLRVAWLFRGFDANAGNTTLFVAADPYDGGIPGPQSAASDTDFDPMIRPRCVLFHRRARTHLKAWAEDCFPAVASRLAAEALPTPELVVTDIESSPRYFLSFRANPGVQFANDIVGWFEDDAARSEHVPELRDDYEFDGGQTLDEWIAARTMLLDGSPINPLPTKNAPPNPDGAFLRSESSFSPTNFNVTHWAEAAGQMSYIETLRQGVFDPIKQAFGSSLPCGEWHQITNSRRYPADEWPTYPVYWKHGVFGVDVQVPVNYGSRRAVYFHAETTDPGWPTVQRWLDRYQLNGVATGASSDPDLDRRRDWINTSRSNQIARSAVRSNDRCQLIPSVSVRDFAGDGTYPYFAEMLPHLVAYMLRCAQLGAASFWVFASEWQASSAVRKATTELASLYTARERARRVRRCSMRRGSRL